jgi:nitrogenase iron protein NifH
MEKVAIYGKGGVGKSVVATGLSAAWAMAGKRVLHVGCDPKHDSAIRLMDGAVDVRTVLEVLGDDPGADAGREILNRGRHGIDCCEAGGPPAGLGCGGRGVARTIEYLAEMEILESGTYDVAVFDVLGDVVCGGFAAPLRDGFAQKVLIVVSEEPMAIFAANNIARAVDAYKRNGVVLAGLVLNLRANDADRAPIDRFAARLSTRVLATIGRDPAVMEGERVQKTVVEHAPASVASLAIRSLADAVAAIDPAGIPAPTPMTDNEFFEFMRTVA